jgi:hypothetical protein
MHPDRAGLFGGAHLHVRGSHRRGDASVIKLRWTKPMPYVGWLGEITIYAGGQAVTKGMQAYPWCRKTTTGIITAVYP